MARSARDDLERFIDRYTAEIASLARAALTKLMERIRGAQVLIYDNYNALAIGFGPSAKASEVIVSIALYPRWVNLFFMQGASLPDPGRILQGKGTRVRHIVLASPDTLDEPKVRDLLDNALIWAKTPIDPAQSGKLIIKAIVEPQRPRRPAESGSKAKAKPKSENTDKTRKKGKKEEIKKVEKTIKIKRVNAPTKKRASGSKDANRSKNR